MKKILIIFFTVLNATLVVSIYSCSKKSESQHEEMTQKQSEHEGHLQTETKKSEKKLYHCPMHPTYISEKPGECPICGMSLVKVEEDKPLLKRKIMYRSTMNPNEVSEKPGKDSMGMDMEPFEVEEGPRTSTVEERSIIKISPEKQQIIGVKTGVVERKPLQKIIRTVGKIDYIEPELAFINTKFEGWIEKLYIDYSGQFVKKGEPLAEVYSPEIVSTQQEYLLVFNTYKSQEKSGIIGQTSSDFSLLESSRQRLKLWDITDAQIKKLEQIGEIKKTLTFYSPVNGFVIEKNVIQGQKIMAGENLYKIADISKVWIYGNIYESEIPLVKNGQEVDITLSYLLGEAFKGRVSYVYPYLDTETRTNKIRIEVDNPDFKLKPGMYANIEVNVNFGTKLAIPVGALLDSGEMKIVEVLEGVVEGEKVVTSATFLIDSESSLKAAIAQMGEPSGGSHAGHGN